MTDIPNTKYITINENGIFVGGEPATHYRGEEIGYTKEDMGFFRTIKSHYPDLEELHILSSETQGYIGWIGNPSAKHGPNAWCRGKFSNGVIGQWVSADKPGSAAGCVRYCIIACANPLYSGSTFRDAFLTPCINTGAKQDEKAQQSKTLFQRIRATFHGILNTRKR